MKFISKSSNLLVVLRPGMSAQPLTGTPAVPALSVRFKDGISDIEEESLIDMMIKHPGFDSDFISSEDVSGRDPFASTRKSAEPAHVMTELKHGTPVSHKTEGGSKPQLKPEMMKIVSEMAKEMAKEMLPTMIEETLKTLVKINPDKESEGPKEPAAEKPVATKPVAPKKVGKNKKTGRFEAK